MDRIKDTVNICYAANEAYAHCMMVSMYSLLVNADYERQYDISIMYKDLNEYTVKKIMSLQDIRQGIKIHLIDVSEYDRLVSERTCTYITSETNYRLFILGKMFEQYDRMLYLDCDTVVCGNICELYDTELNGKAVGVVEAMDHRYFSYTKKARFFENVPYNIDDYKTKVLRLSYPKEYFNGGVVLFDLNKSREIGDDAMATEILNRHHYLYNDQDVLNIMFNEHKYMLDLKWNYTNEIEEYHTFTNKDMVEIYKDSYVDEFGIIHFVSGRKPWKYKTHLDEYYHKYEKQVCNYLKEKENEK